MCNMLLLWHEKVKRCLVLAHDPGLGNVPFAYVQQPSNYAQKTCINQVFLGHGEVDVSSAR